MIKNVVLPPFTGFARPNSGELPGAFFDRVLLSEPISLVRTVWYILQQCSLTGQEIITASYSDLERELNLSHSSVCDGLRRAIEVGYIRLVRPGENGHLKAQYAVNWKNGGDGDGVKVEQGDEGGEWLPFGGGEPVEFEEEGEAELVCEVVGEGAAGQESYGSVYPTGNSSSKYRNMELEESVGRNREGVAAVVGKGTGLPSGLAYLSHDLSQELGDPLHLKSNRTQTLRLWQQSGLDEREFARLMYQSRDLTRRYATLRPGETLPPTGQPRNRMAYFFTVLRDVLTGGSRSHQPSPTLAASKLQPLPAQSRATGQAQNRSRWEMPASWRALAGPSPLAAY